MDAYSGNLTDPAQIDRYGYAGGNPVGMSDPSGNDFVEFGALNENSKNEALPADAVSEEIIGGPDDVAAYDIQELDGTDESVNAGQDQETSAQENLRIRNKKFAGQTAHPKDPAINAKYPDGVKFDENGFPDFSPYAKKTIEIPMQGNYTTDYAEADRLAGIDETYRQTNGLTWHHVEDRTTMQLVPTDLHRAMGHTGGVALIDLLGPLADNLIDLTGE